MKKHEPICTDNEIYQQCLKALEARATEPGGSTKYPPATEKCFATAKKVLDLIFQVHPEIYQGTNFKEGRLKLINIIHSECEIVVEYMHFTYTTHEFKCLADGTIKYTQLLHGEQYENEFYEDEAEFTDVQVRRHIRRKGWPWEPKHKAVA